MPSDVPSDVPTDLPIDLLAAVPAAGFRARRPRDGDLGDLVDLYNAVARQRDLELVGEAELLVHRTRADWWQEAVLVEREADGLVAGYAHLAEEPDGVGGLEVWIEGRVHPDATGNGLATYLIGCGERRALHVADRDHLFGEVVARTTNDNGNDRARALYERLGYRAVRHRLAMRIDLAVAATRSGPRAWGVEVRPFDLERDAEPLWRAMQAGFADHHGFAPTPYEDWRWVLVDRHDDFEPSLWSVAEADGEVIGGVVCEVGVPDDPLLGRVRDLAVLPTWRRKGVADALLKSAFAAFRARGLRRAGLDVDDTTLDGALRLYQRAGMAVARRIDIYERVLRPSTLGPFAG